jgi:prepilin signal peptidase PulO-like enzyme (type II secretory pathway)
MEILQLYLGSVSLNISVISFKTTWGTFYLHCLGFVIVVLFNIVMKTTDKTSENT